MQTTSVKERNYLFDNMKVVLVFLWFQHIISNQRKL